MSDDVDLGTDYLDRGSSDGASMAAVNTMVNSLLNIIAGLEKPTEGKILVDGYYTRGPGPDRGIIFQN